MTKKTLLLFTGFVLMFHHAKPATWIAYSYGYWNSGLTWSTGIVPPSNSADTFIIQYPVVLTGDLTFINGAHIQIDSTGGLCGHHRVTMNTGTTMLKYGVLELDTLLIPGGHVTCVGPGVVVLTLGGMISNGGSMSVNGCAMAVGPWFNCVMPKYFFTGIEEDERSAFNLFPNPTYGCFTLSCPGSFSKALFRLRDITGRTVYEKTIFNSNERIDVSILRNGIYFWDINADNKVSARGKIEIVK